MKSVVTELAFLFVWISLLFGRVLLTGENRPKFCSLPKVTGPCRAAFTRWYYNTNSNKCEKFTYGGCNGNEGNNFKTKDECEGNCTTNTGKKGHPFQLLKLFARKNSRVTEKTKLMIQRELKPEQSQSNVSANEEENINPPSNLAREKASKENDTGSQPQSPDVNIEESTVSLNKLRSGNNSKATETTSPSKNGSDVVNTAGLPSKSQGGSDAVRVPSGTDMLQISSPGTSGSPANHSATDTAMDSVHKLPAKLVKEILTGHPFQLLKLFARKNSRVTEKTRLMIRRELKPEQSQSNVSANEEENINPPSNLAREKASKENDTGSQPQSPDVNIEENTVSLNKLRSGNNSKATETTSPSKNGSDVVNTAGLPSKSQGGSDAVRTTKTNTSRPPSQSQGGSDAVTTTETTSPSTNGSDVVTTSGPPSQSQGGSYAVTTTKTPSPSKNVSDAGNMSGPTSQSQGRSDVVTTTKTPSPSKTGSDAVNAPGTPEGGSNEGGDELPSDETNKDSDDGLHRQGEISGKPKGPPSQREGGSNEKTDELPSEETHKDSDDGLHRQGEISGKPKGPPSQREGGSNEKTDELPSEETHKDSDDGLHRQGEISGKPKGPPSQREGGSNEKTDELPSEETHKDSDDGLHRQGEISGKPKGPPSQREGGSNEKTDELPSEETHQDSDDELHRQGEVGVKAKGPPSQREGGSNEEEEDSEDRPNAIHFQHSLKDSLAYPYEHTSSHFAAFFLTSIVMVFAAYVVYHNRQKIIAIVIEGRGDANGRRRGYRKLETNVEEAMPSLKSSNSTYVY